MPYKDKETRNAYRRAYYEANKEIIKQRARDWFLSHRERAMNNTKHWLRSNFEYKLWKQARDSARQRNLEFNIERSDVIIPEVCPYLSIPLTTIVDGGRQDSNASLDRIDNTKGYIKGNIQVLSSKANFMKRNASIEELITFAKNILLVHDRPE